MALFVDDAHLLDDASAALTHQLAVSGRTLVMATVRTGEPTLDAIVALWKDGLAERVEVSPLSLADVATLLDAVLGGPTAGSVARRLWEHTEGNALFLRGY